MKKVLSTVALCTLAAVGSISAHAGIEEGQLTIWINGDKGYNGLAEVGQQFETDTGIKVTVEHPDKLEEKFSQQASTGDGPDIILWAHDRFGGYAQAGLLTEVKPSDEFRSKFADFTWDAVSYNGKYVGYPVAVEALSLIYNKDLLPTPPKNWEDVVALDAKLKKQGKHAVMWNLEEPFFTWPLLAADGGYAFKFTASGYDAKDVGVNNAGAKRSMSFVKRLVDQGVIAPDLNYAIAEAGFNKGEVALTINGPWAWANIDKAGINYGVAMLPKLNGNPSKPFVGVLTAGISSASPNKDLAVEFLENYLLTNDGLRKVNDDTPLGAVALNSFQEELSSDARIAATMGNAMNGEIMPNIPEMSSFWYAEKAAIKNVVNGRQSVDEALNTVADRMTK
ncbi:maltose/maltodextrin ABC transporter substrate-binding protein MalE [Photobacterium galatheae]|uniref:Maltodextrin-binding protein n=1 Tax=Photobacterium galatheae TaxID=1654360 RepID=A0A066RMT9_9GAMM|nr:maltose/maltodextrin ABC transporter substrate-binding protein MalE [Photobacterium galatheae]KDM91745.1 sugar ABC transporter substrate-binding protein [Photobacterium galatheae]MCM0149855.1 maltose/maltodextrin ABC transporter substrate-binding protein MalE [Photobacterium galatheae]